MSTSKPNVITRKIPLANQKYVRSVEVLVLQGQARESFRDDPSFTQPSIKFADRHPFRIVLINGQLLTELMIRHNVGARIHETLYIKKIDEDFFVDE